MRNKPHPTLSRQEILNQVSEFCRKSMNRTPTKCLAGSNDRLTITREPTGRTSSDISPISYASMGSKESASTRSSVKVAPQVPQRIQSLSQAPSSANHQQQRPVPIYEPIFKRGSVQSYTSDAYDSHPQQSSTLKRVSFTPEPQRPRARTYSDNANQPDLEHYQVPRSYLVMDSEKVSPAHVLKYQHQNQQQQQHLRQPMMHAPIAVKRVPPPSEGVYGVRNQQSYGGQMYAPTAMGQYGYVQTAAPSQIYFPSSAGSMRGSQQLIQAQRLHSDGRTTPLVLHAIPQPRVVTANIYDNRAQAGSIVVLDNVEPLYRPIAMRTGVKGPGDADAQQASSATGGMMRQRGFVRSGKHIVPYEYEVYSDAEDMPASHNRGQTGEFI